MKKYVFLTMVALLTLSLSVSAQDTDKKERKRAPREWPSAEKRAENLAKELDLTTVNKRKCKLCLKNRMLNAPHITNRQKLPVNSNPRIVKKEKLYVKKNWKNLTPNWKASSGKKRRNNGIR